MQPSEAFRAVEAQVSRDDPISVAPLTEFITATVEPTPKNAQAGFDWVLRIVLGDQWLHSALKLKVVAHGPIRRLELNKSQLRKLADPQPFRHLLDERGQQLLDLLEAQYLEAARVVTQRFRLAGFQVADGAAALH